MAESKQVIGIVTKGDTRGIDEVIKKQDKLKKSAEDLKKARSKGSVQEKSEVRETRREREREKSSDKTERRERGGGGRGGGGRGGVGRTAGAVGRVARMTGMRGVGQAASGVSNVARLGAVAGGAVAGVGLLVGAVAALGFKMNEGANRAAQMAKELNNLSGEDKIEFLKKLGDGIKLFRENGATLTAMSDAMEKYQAQPGFWGGVGASVAPIKQGINENLNQMDRAGAGTKFGDAIMGFLSGMGTEGYAQFREDTNAANEGLLAHKNQKASEERMDRRRAEMQEEADLRMLKGGAKTQRLDEKIAEQERFRKGKGVTEGELRASEAKQLNFERMRQENETERKEAKQNTGGSSYEFFDSGSLHNARSALIAAEADAAAEKASESTDASIQDVVDANESIVDICDRILKMIDGNLKVNAVLGD